MKIKKKKQPKSYRPVRIVNPTSLYHSVRVHPCQGFFLKLRKPSEFLGASAKCCPDAEFAIDLNSEFLFIESAKIDDKGNKVYKIAQKYDLTSWFDYGEVSLGEVAIKIIKDDPKNKAFRSSLCVTQISSDPSKLVVVNPMATCVKIEAHQTLEVVCFEPKWSEVSEITNNPIGLKDRWDSALLGESEIKVKEIKYEVAGDRSSVTQKEEGPYVIINRYGYAPNPKLNEANRLLIQEELFKAKKPVRQHHWWFLCSDDSVKEILNKKDGVYDGGFFNFEGSCCSATDEPLECWRGISLVVNVKGKKKNKLHYEKSKVIVREDTGKILTNPFSVEPITFDSTFKKIVIEMVQPNAIWDDLDETVKWNIGFEQEHNPPKFLKVIPLEDKNQWGKRFQRWFIESDYIFSKHKAKENKYLGAILLTCANKQDTLGGVRRLSFWHTPGSEIKSMLSAPDIRPVKINTSTSSATKTTTVYSKNLNGWNGTKNYEGKPGISTIEFEEIISEKLDSGEKTKLLSEIVGTFKSVYRHNYSHYDEPKKKQSENWTSACQRLPYRSETANASSGQNGGRTDTITTASQETKITNIGGNNKGIDQPFILYDPDDQTRVPLKPNQVLRILISLPEKLVHGEKHERWAIAPFCHGRMQVCNFGEKTIGDTKYQEAIIECTDPPKTIGQHNIGCITFKCSKANRSVFVDCEVKEESVPPKQRKMRLITDKTNIHKRFIVDWVHEDEFIVNPKEQFYVRTPAHMQDFHWGTTIEQVPLPASILNQPNLKDIAKDIDINNPWFQVSVPLHMMSSYVFRPLVVSQPYALEILKALATTTDREYQSIARLVFQCNKRQPSIETVIGKVEPSIKLERVLGLCVSLKEYKERVIAIPQNVECAEIIVKPDETIKITIVNTFVVSDRMATYTEIPWYALETPTFISLRSSRKQGSQTAITYKVDNVKTEKEGRIRIASGDRDKYIVVRCKLP